MTQKHKNAEYIIAFVNGEAVEWKGAGLDSAYDKWQDVACLSFFSIEELVFRMKPKTVITKGYKRFACRAADDGKWFVDTYTEGCTYSLEGNEVWIDKEWQYYVIEGKG